MSKTSSGLDKKTEPVPEYSFISQINSTTFIGPANHPIELTPEFTDLKIDVVINCAKEAMYPNRENPFLLEQYPIDSSYPTILEHIDAIYESVCKHVKNKKRIYIHSLNSVSRAPAIMIYYFMCKKNFDFEKCLKLIQKKRSCIDIDDYLQNELAILSESFQEQNAC